MLQSLKVEKTKLFASTMLYAASKRLGYREATVELMRQASAADPDSDTPTPIAAALTIARLVALGYEVQLNVNAGASVIGKGRSLAAREFMQASEADVWLSVDDDVTVSTDALNAAITQARVDQALVVVPCLLRDTTASGGKPTVNLVRNGVSIPSKAPSGGAVETVDAGGFGCFAISRKAVQALLDCEPATFRYEGQLVPALFRDEIIDHEWVTEDFAFCRRLRALHHRLWAVRVGVSVHAGQRLDLRTLEALLHRGELPAQQSVLLR